MTKNSGLDPFLPPEERNIKASVDASILEAIEERKISYPSEVVGDTGMSRQTVYDHIRHLAKIGKLERVRVGITPPDELKGRLSEMWEMGLKGAQIKRMSWYRVKEGKTGE